MRAAYAPVLFEHNEKILEIGFFQLKRNAIDLINEAFTVIDHGDFVGLDDRLSSLRAGLPQKDNTPEDIAAFVDIMRAEHLYLTV